jgi:signal transduction histidine kinase
MSVYELGAWLVLPVVGVVLYQLSKRFTNETLRLLTRLIAFGVAEVGINQASYASYFGPVGEAPGVFWLTSGMTIGVLLLVDGRHFLYYVLVSILVHLHSSMILNEMHWDVALFMVTANLAEEVIGAMLLRYVVGGTPDITRPRIFALYCLICVSFATAIGAAIGSTALSIFYGQENWFRNWQIWWFSDAMGMLSLGSAILAWNSTSPGEPITRSKWARVESIAVVALLVLTAAISIGPFQLSIQSFLDYPYLILPILVWAALRLNARIAIGAAVAVAMLTVFTANGTLGQLPYFPDGELGPFRDNARSVNSAVLAIQAFLFVTLLTTQVLVTLNYQRLRTASERLAIQNQLYESQRMESVAQLAGGVAHDLNNLLAVIRLYRDQVEDRVGDDPSLTPALQAMDDAAGSATAMSRSLLDLARQDEITTGPINVRQLLSRTMQICKPLLHANIQVKLDLEVNKDLVIIGDANHLQQAVLNLVLNARDAMTPGGGTLSVWVRPCDESMKRVEIGVRDTGVGIPAEELEHVFEPLFTTKEHGKGTGLGLSIVHSIMDAHGGTIKVESTPGEGTTMRLLLPFNPAEAQLIKQLNQNESAVISAQQTSGSEDPLTVLVFIGHPQVRGAVLAELHNQGFEAESCDSIEDLLELAGRAGETPSNTRAVVDLRSITRHEMLTAGPLPIPMIVLSDQSPPPDLADSSSRVLQLPFKIQQLVDAVREIR